MMAPRAVIPTPIPALKPTVSAIGFLPCVEVRLLSVIVSFGAMLGSGIAIDVTVAVVMLTDVVEADAMTVGVCV